MGADFSLRSSCKARAQVQASRDSRDAWEAWAENKLQDGAKQDADSHTASHREQWCLQAPNFTICMAKEVFLTGSFQMEPLLFHHDKKKSLQLSQLKINQ